MKKFVTLLLIATCTFSTAIHASTTDSNPVLITQIDQSTTFITIKTTSSYNFLSIYNESGVLVKKVMIGNAGKNKVDISDLRDGNYSAVLSGNETGNGTFVVNR